jgi:hypothetical protein
MSKRKKQKKADQAMNTSTTITKISEEKARQITQRLSNHQALAALETEHDEILLSLMLSLNPEGFNRMVSTALESEHSKRSFTAEYDGITIEMTLPSLADLHPINQLTYNPYQISRIQIDPSLEKLAPEELSLQILTAFQQAAIDGFLEWLRFCLLTHDVWEDGCRKEAEAIVAKSNRVQFNKTYQSTESLEPNPEKRLQRILSMIMNHTTVLYEDFAAVWQKGLNRFIREHPQLVSQAEKRNLKKLIQVLEEVNDCN